jgi:hypothetical protein
MPHSYDYSRGGRIRPALLQFIRGIRGKRQGEVTLKQIVGYFSGTPEEHVRKELDELIVGGHVDIRRTAMSRSHNTRCVYTLSDKGMATFGSYVRDGACHLGGC